MMLRLWRVTLAAAVAGSTACATAGGRTTGRQSVETAKAEIVSMMDSSARAWNRGDLDGFITSYDQAPTTTFVTPTRVIHGVQSIRALYAPHFAPGGVRDSLSFEQVEVDLLAPDVANVIAYYRLSRGDSTTARGPTSLVMRRRAGAWRIVHDHSS